MAASRLPLMISNSGAVGAASRIARRSSSPLAASRTAEVATIRQRARASSTSSMKRATAAAVRSIASRESIPSAVPPPRRVVAI